MQSPSESAPPVEGAVHDRLVARRYRIEAPIGRGGMADVYRVTDQSSGALLALKQLRPVDDPTKRARSLELFEREFHTLAQLSHPRIVQVHDYGVDAESPYYTMELLDGGDLQERAPLGWRAACAVARDVCSALSLLHSRKMVYRDLSPRNVRLTGGGQAKMIDFGAMIPIGPSRQALGTPGFCAPEVVHLQPLDARTDLYALGATLYFMLTGRRAHAARDFRQLAELWGVAPRPPSEFVPDVPHALDALVLELLQVDPALRPSSAGAAMERLSAIGGEAEGEQLLVAQAYLSTPTLVGRDGELERMRRKIASAQRGRGGAVLIDGPPGAGRSRLLDACALEAKLAGMTVLRADSLDAQRGAYGVVQALAGQLLELHPEPALAAASPQLGVLGHVVPQLREASPAAELVSFEDSDQLRQAVQPALRKWFAAVARTRPLLVAVDDVHRIDEPSAAFSALLASEAEGYALIVVASAANDGSQRTGALRVFAEASLEFGIGGLAAADSERLLRSLFGDVQHVQLLADRLHALAAGNPRDLMRLAEHLLARNLLRYHAGAWSLPAGIDPADLPSSMADALRARVDALPQGARELAQALALCGDQHVAFDECLLLAGHRDAGRLIASLDQLAASEIVRLGSEHYGISQQGWLSPLLAALGTETRARLQYRLSELFERRGQDLRAAQHLLLAGEEQRGVAALVAAAERSQRMTDQNTDVFQQTVRTLPAGWFDTFERAIALCDEQGMPKRDAAILRMRQATLSSSLTGISTSHPFIALVTMLERESGLDLYAQLDPSLAPSARVARALELAQARYQSLPEHECVHDPRSAIAQLARIMISAAGVVAAGNDHALLRALPDLAPYSGLSPMMGVVERLGHGLQARMTGRTEEGRSAYYEHLDRLSGPDRGGLGASYHRHISLGVMCALGLIEASMGLESSREWAAKVEADPLYHVNAWQIRMLHHLWQGRVDQAESCSKQVELLRIQNSPRQWLDGVHILGEVTAYAAIGDLVRVKQIIATIRSLAERFVGWVPVLHYANGEYARLRGDLPAALAEFEAGLALVHAGGHQSWVHLAAGRVQTLFDLGRHADAIACGRADLEAAARQDLGYFMNYLRMPLALAEAHTGAVDTALEHSQAALDDFLRLGSMGLNLGLAYETRARVANLARDQAGFDKFAALCAEQYRASENRILTARYDRLVAEARGAELGVSGELVGAADFSDTGSTAMLQLSSMMEGCAGPKERARRSLELLLKASGVSEGFLYALVGDAAVATVQLAEHELPRDIDTLAKAYLESHMQSVATGTAMATATATAVLEDHDPSTSMAAAGWRAESGRTYQPIVLGHIAEDGFALVGAAVVVVDPQRPFFYPARLAADLSRFACESGDAVAFMCRLA